MVAKMSFTSGASKIAQDKPVPCTCGTEPVLQEFKGPLCPDLVLIEYQCPKCKKTSPVRWLPTQTGIAIGTWNQFILLGY
jgi:hypothetical protein